MATETELVQTELIELLAAKHRDELDDQQFVARLGSLTDNRKVWVQKIRDLWTNRFIPKKTAEQIEQEALRYYAQYQEKRAEQESYGNKVPVPKTKKFVHFYPGVK